MNTRAEHLAWCKTRALQYVDAGNLQEAMASMLSDLTKHQDTAPSAKIGMILMMTVDRNSPQQVRSFITGFN